VLGDGDAWIKNIAQGPYFMAMCQLDWRHLMVKIHQTFSDQPKLVSELIDYLYSRQGEKMLATVKLARLLCDDRDKSQRIADLVTYIESNRDGLYGSRSLRGKVEDKTVLVCSTGAMGKNIDTVIDRRFKRHGQSWTTDGVNNLLKLRTLWYNTQPVSWHLDDFSHKTIEYVLRHPGRGIVVEIIYYRRRQLW
jgi:hypothetical protein